LDSWIIELLDFIASNNPKKLSGKYRK